jgi:hypothetical protein
VRAASASGCDAEATRRVPRRGSQCPVTAHCNLFVYSALHSAIHSCCALRTLAFRTPPGLPGAKAAESFDATLAAVVRPLGTACERSAAALDASAATDAALPEPGGGAGSPAARAPTAAVLPPGAGRTFLVNCLLSIWAPLSAHAACGRQAQALKARAEAEVRAVPFVVL